MSYQWGGHRSRPDYRLPAKFCWRSSPGSRLPFLELQATVAEQQAVIIKLQRRIESLEGEGKAWRVPRMPGIKPKSGQGRPEDKGPRKPRPHGFARQRMTPTHRVEHVLESCSECGTGLGRGMGAADPGSHRYSGRSHSRSPSRSSLPGSARCASGGGFPGADLNGVAVGPAALGGQPGQSDNGAARRGASARSDRPVVSPNGPPVAPKRRRHRGGHPWVAQRPNRC